MAPGGADKRLEKSYLSSAVDSINPWAASSRSTTPTPKDVPVQQQLVKGTGSVAGDHSTTHLYGCSAKSYPSDCPPLKVLWFHAVDIPKRKAKYASSKPVDDSKPPQQPKKYVQFSSSDSRAIEAAYQTLLEKSERSASAGKLPKTTTNVPVNEDYLFDVNIEQRELSPVYWIGPVIATYQDSNTAWLSSDTMLSWVTSTMYERFSGGGYMSGVKLRPAKQTSTETSVDLDEKEQRRLKRRSAPPSTGPGRRDTETGEIRNDQQFRETHLQRQLSSLMGDTGNAEEKEEAMRRQAEQEIQDDYTGLADETQGRDIEHLCLVTHGIGQLLGMKMESLNFVHDVNVMRKVMKTTYANSVDLRALNGELGDGFKNCRVQVLPVCWRHLLDFPKKREKKGERDLADASNEEDEYPSLDDITIEGVAFARSLISDLALDVLLYQSAYREQISEIVLQESNRIHKLFMKRNPGFKGKVHIMGHSLGSAIMFDILCRQKEATLASDKLANPLRFWPAKDNQDLPKKRHDLQFEFDVEDFYCLGSPVGLFQMLKGRTVAARHLADSLPSESPLNPDDVDDPFLSVRADSSAGERVSQVTGLPFSVSSPKVAQLYNIFHPSDPISYRLEPLISTSMSSQKTNERKNQLASPAGDDARTSMSGNDPTLIDDELETLYSKFQEKFTQGVPDEGLAAEDRVGWDRKARKLRHEDMKIRALNRNGRVDYSIQESVLDFNPINTIASHMGYWADEDVNHFILSQLLSSKSRDSKKSGSR
ncbi:phospholipase C20G8.02 like protein [Verticillium longisporum]|uniref:Phospholipase C20G8.02 like protein n=1 Tax=Verticillium longisporum TaxID=100787 RepID=A0A8I3AIE0_VERLO|nr:phospholipase C20G8.02 like protein [Verticillium longisporum]